MEDYLIHYGILGQKWGVRRYQNSDGSYTKAGLKRYNQSKDRYETAKKDYKVAKDFYKNGGEKVSLKKMKQETKNAKKQMNKDYKHLKQDKMADKGKARYANGERIRENNSISKLLKSVGGLSIATAAYTYNNNMIDKKTASVIASIGLLSTSSGVVYDLAKRVPNNQLRAYYAHTSNY